MLVLTQASVGFLLRAGRFFLLHEAHLECAGLFHVNSKVLGCGGPLGL
jgi:hypothetical protein